MVENHFGLGGGGGEFNGKGDAALGVMVRENLGRGGSALWQQEHMTCSIY